MAGSISKAIAGKGKKGFGGGLIGKIKDKLMKKKGKTGSPGQGGGFVSKLKAATEGRAKASRKRGAGSSIRDAVERRRKQKSGGGEGGKL